MDSLLGSVANIGSDLVGRADHRPVVLFDDIVEVFALPQPHAPRQICLRISVSSARLDGLGSYLH